MILNLITRLLARPAVTDWLIKRAKRTPYFHIYGDDDSLYMERYWLFNPYPKGADEKRWWKDLLPSVRLHRIVRKDQDLHDHPWDARSFVLRGWYIEERLEYPPYPGPDDFRLVTYYRVRGQTFVLKFGEFHRISQVSLGGVWTLFVTFKKKGSWGFLVNGRKIHWREYIKKGTSNERT